MAYYAHSDYYAGGPDQLKGQWIGSGATLLGLQGDVALQQFEMMVNNRHPFTGEKLTQRDHASRRVGTDITVSVPKSVSILWGVSQDQQILDAIQSAAHETFAELEHDAQTRVNLARGELEYAKTGNLVAASWIHTTARPVDGHPDPHLHVHMFAINATHTGERWTAADLSAIVADSGYFEAAFQSRLAANLTALGYAVERNARDFELAGISRQTIEKFSRRTEQVEEKARQLGITNAKVKGELGATTRESKESDVPPEQLPSVWESRLDREEKNILRQVLRQNVGPKHRVAGVGESVDFATQHVFERDSVVRERQLKRVALLQSIGNSTPEQIHQQVYARDFIREGHDAEALITTREVLAEEQRMLAFARSGRGELPALAPNHMIKRSFLSGEQQDAISGLLDSHDRLQIVRGVAGSGKTTLMQEAIEAMQHQGHTVTVLAPTAEAAYSVLHDKEGFDAHTLAKFLVDKEMQAESSHGVIWVDEAGLVGSRDLSRLTRIATDIDARIILSGDVRQHQPVARGQPLKLLESQAGVTPFEIKTIRRQQGYYRDAVTDLSEGQIAEGVTKLQQLGFIREIEDDDERVKQLATEYADVLQSGKTALVIAPAHAERRQVVGAIRNELKTRGIVGQDERAFDVLRQKNLTDSQKSDVLSYAPGDVIEFKMRGRGGFRSGNRIEVTRISDDEISGIMAGKQVSVPLAAKSSFEVYERRSLNLAKGDVIRLTKNRAADKNAGQPRLNNGSLLTIDGFTRKGDIKTKDGKVLPATWQHFDEGFTVTSYSSQGKTIDHVFVAQSEASYPASSPEQAYVSASRGKSTLRIYTDSIDQLKRAISKDRTTKMASELVPNTDKGNISAASAVRSNLFTDLQKRARDFASQQLERFQQWMTAHQHPQHAR